MINFQNISDVSLSQNEFCSLVGYQYYANTTFKLRIPKLMPSVTSPMNDPFNKNILVNASDCKPSVNNTLRVQNYITVQRSPQCSLAHKIVNIRNEVPDGLGITCLCMNGNYKDMAIVDSL